MRINSKLTGGLAWAGLFLVLAVPSADILTRSDSNKAASITSDMAAVETATSVPAVVPVAPAPRVVLARPGEEPVVVETAEGDDPVDQYLQSGKKLPSYISDAPGEVAATDPAPVTKLVVPAPASVPATVEVAAVDENTAVMHPDLIAPLPYPAEMRPVAGRPVTTANAADDEPVLIVDEDLVARREAAVAAVLDDEPVDLGGPVIVTGDELEEWDSGSLADYLERRGLMSDGDQADSDYDEDGFFLDDGPNNDRSDRRLIRRLPDNRFFFF